MKKLNDYTRVIFYEKHTNEEWIQLNKEVDLLWETASEKERQEFEESGACDMLGMILEYPD